MPACARCVNANPQGARFCNSCGQRLGLVADAAQTSGSFLSRLWRQLPKWKYLILAGLLVGSTLMVKWLASDNSGFEDRVKTATKQLQKSLELLDVTNLAKAYSSAVTDHLWECRDRCEPSFCGGAFFSDCSALCLWLDNAACRRCKDDQAERDRCLSRPVCSHSCKGFSLLNVVNAPFVAASGTAGTLWHQLHWSGFVVAVMSALLGAVVVAEALERLTRSSPNGWVVCLLAPPVALAIAFLLKWTLILLLIFFGYSFGLLLWILGFGGGSIIVLLEVLSTARHLQSTVEGSPTETDTPTTNPKQ
jgi:hypothetical protein